MIFQELLDKIEFQLKHKHPFVLYHLPDANEVKLIAQNNSSHIAFNFQDKGFIFAPFSKKNPTYFIPLSEAELSLYDATEFVNEQPDFQTQNYTVQPQNKQTYLDVLEKTISELKETSLQKVVISKQIQLSFEELNESFLIKTFQQSVKEYFSAFGYLFFHPDEGFWMGATPEQLIATDRNKLKTVALAGTQLYHGSTEVSWGKKEDEEQQYVVDAILDALNPFCLNIVASKKYTKKAGNLLHLNTDIKANFEPNKLQAIVEALHPTPAVCGLPKDKAMNFILQNENYNRNYYTGYLGELNYPIQKQRVQTNRNQELQAIKQIVPKTQLFVNLRCMHLYKTNISIFVGGGVTAQSNPEHEWLETEHKSKTMLKVL